MITCRLVILREKPGNPSISSFLSKFIVYFLVKESSATELERYGRSDLIKDTLKKLLFCREQEIVNILIPCWLRLLTKVEKCDDHSKISSADLLMKELLYKIEMESDFELKYTYCNHLKSLIKMLDIGCVRWMSSGNENRLVRISVKNLGI